MRKAASPSIVALAAALALGALPARADEEDVAARAHRAEAQRVLDESYQVEMPGEKVEPKPEVMPREEVKPTPSPRISEPTQAVASLLLWCLAIAAGAIVIVGIARAWMNRGASVAAESADDRDAAGATASAPRREVIPVGEAEALAARGAYGEAIHALLGSVLAHIAKKGQVAVGPSTTSREVLESAPLEAEAAAALRDLVATVEVSLFGGLEVDAEDWQRCVRSYRRLEGALDR